MIERTGCENIIIIATNEKLRSLQGKPLRVDTGDEALNEKLRGVRQIITGYDSRTLYNVS